MNCHCKADLENELTARFKEMEPKARDHKVTLEGYGLGIRDNHMIVRGYMEAKARAGFPTKSGAEKWRTVRQNMIFSFCPFCGKAAGATTEGGTRE